MSASIRWPMAIWGGLRWPIWQLLAIYAEAQLPTQSEVADAISSSCTPLACCMVIHHMHEQSVYLSHAHLMYFVLMPFLHMLTYYFQAYCIVAKMVSQGEAESQVPFWNHVLKIPKREALIVC